MTALAALLLRSALAAPASQAYDTEFVGGDAGTRADLQAVSQLVALQDQPPPSELALHRRAESDMTRLKAVADADGYFESKLDFTLTRHGDSDHVTVTVHPGPRYHFGPTKILLPSGAAPPGLPGRSSDFYGLPPGQPALSAPVLAAEGLITRAYAESGWPFARIVGRRVVVDHATKTMAVTYTLDPGAAVRFGPVMIEGLTRLDPGFLLRRVKWVRGQRYDQRLVDSTRQALVTSALFGAVEIVPGTTIAADGSVPMQIRVTERALHSISLGGFYNSSEGAVVDLIWEHRDLFGHAEDLKATAEGGQSRNGIILDFKRPDIAMVNQDLIANITAENELVNAFRSLREAISVGVQQRFSPSLIGGWSIAPEHARVDEKVDYRVYSLVGLPAYLRQDMSDDLLNPTRGYRANIEVTPFLRELGSDLTYIQSRVTASSYESLDPDHHFVAAEQIQLGSTYGASLSAIPKDHRFYVGGGGSVRGFGFQKAGPLDTAFNPIGGRSQFESSVELRAMVSDSIGIVPFFDAGSVYAADLPDFTHSLYCGAGIGVRYLTAVGPLRLDLATPINPHSQGDSPIQVYLSLGQAF